MSTLTQNEAGAVAAYVRRLLAGAPPLTDQQRDRLGLLLRRPQQGGKAA